MSQKAPRDPLGPRRIMKIIFWVARISKPHGRKKNFWVISHRRKDFVTISGTWRSFWIFADTDVLVPKSRWLIHLFDRYDGLGHFELKKNYCRGRCKGALHRLHRYWLSHSISFTKMKNRPCGTCFSGYVRPKFSILMHKNISLILRKGISSITLTLKVWLML